MISAPSVNQIRFLRSVALPKAEKLMLAASCSAADAIQLLLCRWRCRLCFRLGVGFCGRLRRRDGRQDNLAAEFLHRGDRRLRRAGNFDGEGRFQFALGQKPYAISDAAKNARLDQRFAINLGVGFKRARIERLLQTAEIDDVEMLAEILAREAALGQPPVQRRLAAFEAVQGNAGARGLALAAARAGLALARADAPAAAFGAVMSAPIVLDLVQFHGFHRLSPIPPRRRNQRTSSTCTRCFTRSIIPPTAGVSSSTRVRRILLRPSPLRVASCLSPLPAGLAICVPFTPFAGAGLAVGFLADAAGFLAGLS